MMDSLYNVLCKKRWLLMGLLASIGYIFYFKFLTAGSKVEIMENYKGIFYSEEEISRFQAPKVDRVKDHAYDTNKTCSFSCSEQPYGKPRTLLEDIIYAGNAHAYNSVDDENSGDLSSDDAGIDGGDAVDSYTIIENDYNNNSNSSSSSSNNSSSNNGTSIPSTGTSVGRRLTREETKDTRHHGCCVSSLHHVVPTRMTTVFGTSVRAVQFRHKKQIYWKDDCYQLPASRCSGCSCYVETRHMLALVVDDNGDEDYDEQLDDETYHGYRLEMVVVPGSCKCLNGR